MKKLNKPITANSRGKQVADLHEIMVSFGFRVTEEEISKQFYGESTKNGVKLFQEQFSEELEVSGELDETTMKKINSLLSKGKDKDKDDKDKDNGNAKGKGGSNNPKPERYRVKGHCYDANEKPHVKAIVKAYDRDLRSEELLGQTKTDAKGYYEIWYTPAKFSKAETATAEIVVKIENSNGKVLAQSPIYFNAPKDITIDLKIGGGLVLGPSEYEQLRNELAQLLQGLTISDLREDKEYQDITFISSETGKNKSQIAELVLANLVLKQTQIPAEIFYCLFRQNIPGQITNYVTSYLQNSDATLTVDQILNKILNDTIAVNIDILKTSIQLGINKNIISFRFLSTLDKVISQFKELQVQLALQKPYFTGKTSMQWELLGPLEPPQPPNIYYAIPISPAWMQGSLAINHGWMAFSTVSGLPNELLAEQFLQNELGEIIEKKEGSKHINIVRLDEIFKPVLNKKKIEKNWSNDRQTNALLSSEAPFIAITENGSYSAIV